MKKLFLLVGILLALYPFCRAQNPIVRWEPTFPMPYSAPTIGKPAYYSSDTGIASPQAWSMMKYGGSTPNLYTGTVSVSIPVYTYQDEDFTFPVSLNYASNGYIPNVQAGDVGLGWTLNLGGCITRTINGIADEGVMTTTGIGGFFDLDVEDFAGRKYYTDLGVFPEMNSQNNIDYTSVPNLDNAMLVYIQSGKKIETEPDYYHFNFMGHTGSFIQTGRTVHTFETSHPHGEYSVDIDEEEGGITITTGDGYVYAFVPATEPNDAALLRPVIFSGGLTQMPTSLPMLYPEMWVLECITAPNGRSVSLTYLSEPSESLVSNMRPGGRYIRSKVVAPGSFSGQDEDDYHRIEYTNRTPQIESVQFDTGLTIRFDYKEKRQKEKCLYAVLEEGAEVPALKYSVKQLESITVETPQNSPLKTCRFYYTHSSGNPVLFLNRLDISGEGEYRMGYHGLDQEFPYHCTLNVDHWGYNCGPGVHGALNHHAFFPDRNHFDRYRNWTDIVDSFDTRQWRSPNKDYSMMGILTKLTYPTGGTTTFEYESHTYVDYLHKTNYTGGTLDLRFGGKIREAGGLRIKKITDNPLDGSTPKVRTYLYETPDGESSGNLLLHPYYLSERGILVSKGSLGGTTTNVLYLESILSTGELDGYRTDRPHIEYETVKEEYHDGSYTVYNFVNYHTCPDNFYQQRIFLEIPGLKYELTEYLQMNSSAQQFFFMPPDYYPKRRGRVSSVFFYDSDGAVSKEIIHQYDNFSCANKWIASWKPTVGGFYTHYTYFGACPLVKTTVNEYADNSQTISSETEYRYNDYGQLKEEISYRNGVKIGTKKWERVTDASQKNPNNPINFINVVHARMLDLNLSGSILREDVLDADDRVIGSRKYNYGFYPKGSVVSFGDPHLQEIMDMVATPTPPASVGEVSYSTTERYDYDSRGHVTERIDKDGVPTCYIWDKNNIVAVGVNCTWVEAHAKIDSKYPLFPLLRPSPETLWQLLQGIPNAQFTVFSHKPHVGILTMTNPRGETTYYDYTETEKLESVSKLDRTTVDANDKSRISSYEYSAE